MTVTVFVISISVSYTHLDVYKRQPMHKTVSDIYRAFYLMLWTVLGHARCRCLFQTFTLDYTTSAQTRYQTTMQDGGGIFIFIYLYTLKV